MQCQACQFGKSSVVGLQWLGNETFITVKDLAAHLRRLAKQSMYTALTPGLALIVKHGLQSATMCWYHNMAANAKQIMPSCSNSKQGIHYVNAIVTSYALINYIYKNNHYDHLMPVLSLIPFILSLSTSSTLCCHYGPLPLPHLLFSIPVSTGIGLGSRIDPGTKIKVPLISELDNQKSGTSAQMGPVLNL